MSLARYQSFVYSFVNVRYCLAWEAKKAMKHKVKFDPVKIKVLYRAGKNVSQIALAIGYPKGTGNNRVRNVLIKSKVYKSAKAAKKSTRAKAASA